MLLILILQIIFFLATQFSRAESCALSCLALFYFVLGVVKAGVEGIPTKSALVSIICSRMGKKGIGKEIAKKEMEKRGGKYTLRAPVLSSALWTYRSR